MPIPYKNFENSPYNIIGWPLDEPFKDFKCFNVENRKKILNSKFNIKFTFK